MAHLPGWDDCQGSDKMQCISMSFHKRWVNDACKPILLPCSLMACISTCETLCSLLTASVGIDIYEAYILATVCYLKSFSSYFLILKCLYI